MFSARDSPSLPTSPLVEEYAAVLGAVVQEEKSLEQKHSSREKDSVSLDHSGVRQLDTCTYVYV